MKRTGPGFCLAHLLAVIAMLVSLPAPAQNSPPEVDSVSASQRLDASKLVDITYNLTDAEGDPCNVNLQVSDDGGATWSVWAVTTSGDIGSGVTPGAGKWIVWNPAADIPGQSGTDFRVRVCADDGYAPAGMVFIPGGEFWMGDHYDGSSSDEHPVHAVQVDSFSMDIYETTNQEYCAYLNAAYNQNLVDVISGTVYQAGSGTSYPYCSTTTASSYSRIAWDEPTETFSVVTDKGDHPMVMVSWYGAAAYANWRSAQEGRTPCYNLSTWECSFAADGFRLPTEAEWEYAARGDIHYARYPWGNSIDGSMANYSGSGDPYEGETVKTTPVGYYAANGYGLYDMAGNVWEWCNDWYGSSYYSSSPYDNPQGPASGTSRVLRGGPWGNDASNLRCAERYGSSPGHRYRDDGFRLARD